MRDLETIYNAIKAAETGHLVFATLHTNSAANTQLLTYNSRRYAPCQQIMKCVVAQLLLKKLAVAGSRPTRFRRCPGFPAMVREGKTSQINNFMMTNKELGMQTSMDSAFATT